MNGEDPQDTYERARNKVNGESISTLQHIIALRDLEARYEYALRQSDKDLQAERDRRYAEVNVEKEKALKIKETADLAALQLARQIQEYKDEKANELREQIGSERGHYATKEDLSNTSEKLEAAIKPLTAWTQSQQGRSAGLSDGWKYLIGFVSFISTVAILLNIFHPFKVG